MLVSLGKSDEQRRFAQGSYDQQDSKKHDKTPAQIILRWHIQEGLSVIPGSTNPEHIGENIQIFDFYLTNEEMQNMRSLDKEQRFFNAKQEEVEKMVWSIQL